MSRCEICDYSTSRYSNFVRHLSSLRHGHRTKLSTKDPHFLEKISSNYDFKQQQQKDQKNTRLTYGHRTILNKTENENVKYMCENCGKAYKSRNSLWYHKKKCDYTNTEIVKNNNETIDINNNYKKELDDIKDMINTLMSQQTTHDITINNTINNNQKMSINVYLNQYCNEAINMSDFIEQIQLTLNNLLLTKEQGYTKSMSNIFLQNLSELEYNKRPFHCSDKKRQQFYIRYDNKWNRDNGENITKAVDKVATKHILKLKEWEEEHPDWIFNDTLNQEYMLMLQNILGGKTNEEQERNKKEVVKIISEAVLIKKAIKSVSNNDGVLEVVDEL